MYNTAMGHKNASSEGFKEVQERESLRVSEGGVNVCVCVRGRYSAGGKVERIKTKQGRIKARGGGLDHAAFCNLQVSIVCCVVLEADLFQVFLRGALITARVSFPHPIVLVVHSFSFTSAYQHQLLHHQ